MTTPTTSNPELLHLLRTGFPVLKPQVAVDISHELKVVIPPPTTDPFDTAAWDDLLKAIDEVRDTAHVEEKQNKKRHEREGDDAPLDELEEEEEDEEPEEAVDSDGPEEEEDLRMALETQHALDGYDRVFQGTRHRVSTFFSSYFEDRGNEYKKLLGDEHEKKE